MELSDTIEKLLLEKHQSLKIKENTIVSNKKKYLMLKPISCNNSNHIILNSWMLLSETLSLSTTLKQME